MTVVEFALPSYAIPALIVAGLVALYLYRSGTLRPPATRPTPKAAPSAPTLDVDALTLIAVKAQRQAAMEDLDRQAAAAAAAAIRDKIAPFSVPASPSPPAPKAG